MNGDDKDETMTQWSMYAFEMKRAAKSKTLSKRCCKYQGELCEPVELGGDSRNLIKLFMCFSKLVISIIAFGFRKLDSESSHLTKIKIKISFCFVKIRYLFLESFNIPLGMMSTDCKSQIKTANFDRCSTKLDSPISSFRLNVAVLRQFHFTKFVKNLQSLHNKNQTKNAKLKTMK